MYKNMTEKMKACKEASANIAVTCLILLVLILTIAYFAGVIDTQNIFINGDR